MLFQDFLININIDALLSLGIPLEFMRSLDTVMIADSDHHKTDPSVHLPHSSNSRIFSGELRCGS